MHLITLPLPAHLSPLARLPRYRVQLQLSSQTDLLALSHPLVRKSRKSSRAVCDGILQRIIWRFEHGLHASKRFSGRYETILWFTKSDNYTFNLDPVRVPSKYPGKLHFKGAKRGQPSGNPLGKNPSDVWKFLREEWESCDWDIPNVKSNHIEKTTHPCQFPVELVERCVLALTNEEDRVLDPYSGVSSTLLAALMHGRKAVGVEKEAEYITISKERIAQLANGTLKTRPLGQPVHKPTGREKVAQVPIAWQKQNDEETES